MLGSERHPHTAIYRARHSRPRTCDRPDVGVGPEQAPIVASRVHPRFSFRAKPLAAGRMICAFSGDRRLSTDQVLGCRTNGSSRVIYQLGSSPGGVTPRFRVHELGPRPETC